MGRVRQVNQQLENNLIKWDMLALFTEVSPLSDSLKDLNTKY